MGELNLDELERLAKAATPGPWEWWTSNSFLRLTGADRRDGGVLYACNIRNEYATVVVSEADRRFIAEARTALPALIARIRELEKGLTGETVPVNKHALIDCLVLIDPAPLHAPDGKTYVFNNPNAAYTLRLLSAAVRRLIPGASPAPTAGDSRRQTVDASQAFGMHPIPGVHHHIDEPTCTCSACEAAMAMRDEAGLGMLAVATGGAERR